MRHCQLISTNCCYNLISLIVPFNLFLPDVIFHEQGEGEEFSYTTGEHNYRAMNLSTSGGTIQLLFEEHEQYSSWRTFISYLMNNKGVKGKHIAES